MGIQFPISNKGIYIIIPIVSLYNTFLYSLLKPQKVNPLPVCLGLGKSAGGRVEGSGLGFRVYGLGFRAFWFRGLGFRA